MTANARPARPAAVLAMHRSVADNLFGADRAELREVVDLLDPAPLTSFADERAGHLLAAADVVVTGWGTPVFEDDVLAGAPRLRAIVHAAGTVKGFVTPACWGRGIRVTSVAAANARPVAEYTLAAILLANKGAFLAHQRYRAERRLPPWDGPFPVPGNRLKRVGVVGASQVGRAVIALLAPFDLEVVVSDPLLTPETAAAIGARLLPLDELVSTSDVVSIHAPLLPETVGLFDRRRLALLRDRATLINTARGAIVDGDALVDELRAGRITAVIDTTDPEPLPPESPLYDLPNVFLTPHLAGSQGTELARLAAAAIAELARFARGERFLHEILEADLPWIA